MRAVLVRNPFYWKVDPEGNQLPYIDYMDIEVVENEETRLLNLSEGKYDASFRDGSSNRPTFRSWPRRPRTAITPSTPSG